MNWPPYNLAGQFKYSKRVVPKVVFVILALCIVLLKGEPPEHFEQGYLCIFPCSSFLQLQPVVLSLHLEKHPHSMMLQAPRLELRPKVKS